MPITQKNVHHAIAAAIVADLVVYANTRRLVRKTRKENNTLRAIVKYQDRHINYLCDVLDRNDVKVTAFDKIAMHDLKNEPI